MSVGDPPLATSVAPGKLILLGEHAVVFSRPALAVPIRAVEARATVWASDDPLAVDAHFPPGSGMSDRCVVVGDDPTSAIAIAARAALDHAMPGRAEDPAWRIDLASTVPLGAGMGSSAAVAVALVRAIGLASGVEIAPSDVAQLALAAERATHGTPSGIDNTVIALGRPIVFRAGVSEPMPVGADLDLVVADSGDVGATVDLVASVRRQHEARPSVVEDWFDRIEALVEDARRALAAGDVDMLGRAMTANHLVLQALGVSTDRLNRLVAAARGSGALGAKLSGAGGGGVVVALAPSGGATAVERALREAGAASVIRSIVPADTGQA